MSLPSHVQITNLIHRYAELVDAGDVDGLMDLFAYAEIRRRDGVVRGEAIRSNFGRLPIGKNPGVTFRHVTTNLILDIDEDAGIGSARCYATVLKCTAGDRIEAIVSNRYHDDFTCTDGVWRFAVRRYLDTVTTASTAHVIDTDTQSEAEAPDRPAE